MVTPPLDHERRLAALMHLASIPAPFVSPLIGVALFRKSPYMIAHSVQSLMEAIILKVVLVVAGLASIAWTVTQLLHHYRTDWMDWNWTTFLLRIAMGWLIVASLGVITTIQAVIAAHRANQGAWPRHGMVQRAALRRFE